MTRKGMQDGPGAQDVAAHATAPEGASQAQGEPQKQRRGRRAAGRKNGEGTYDLKRGMQRFRVPYVGPDGRSRTKEITSGTLKALRVKVKAWQEELARGLPVAGDEPTVERLVDEWLATKVNLRSNSLRDYGQIAARIKAGLDGHKVKLLTDAHIQAWINGERKKGRAASTLTKTKALLHQLLAHGERRGYVMRNVARLVNVPKRDQIDPDVYDRAQVERLLEEARAPRQPGQIGRPLTDWHVLLTVHAMTGLRPSELLALRWSDIRWNESMIFAQRGLLWTRGEAVPKLTPMKNAYSRRQIPVPPVVLDALQDHRAAQDALKAILKEGYDDWGLVFAVTNGPRIGSPIQEDTVSRAFAQLCASAGLPKMRWYNLRHSYATMLLDAGVPLHVVSGLMGHASVKITADIYGARAKRNTDVAGTYINKLFGGSPLREVRAAPLPALPTPLLAATG